MTEHIKFGLYCFYPVVTWNFYVFIWLQMPYEMFGGEKWKRGARCAHLFELKSTEWKKPRLDDDNPNKKKPKDQKYVYWLNNFGGEIQVCETAFLNVYGISDGHVSMP